MAFCGKCGSENPETHRFCWKCGCELVLVGQYPSATASVLDMTLELLGRRVTQLEYRRNHYADLSDTGEVILKFISEDSDWRQYQDSVDVQTPIAEYRKATDARLRSMNSLVDTLATLRVPSSLTAINEESAAYVRAAVQLLELQRDSRVGRDGQYEAAIKRQFERATKHRERLDQLIHGYRTALRQTDCPNCGAWVLMDAKTCHYCQRDFTAAERLNLLHHFSVSVAVQREPGSVLSLRVATLNASGDFPVWVTWPILMFIDYAVAKMSDPVRRVALAELGSVHADVNKRLATKSFSWAEACPEPSQNSTNVARVSLHYVSKADEIRVFDVLYEVHPVAFIEGPEAPEFLSCLAKSVMSHGSPEACKLFAAMFRFAYTDRWLSGAFLKHPGVSWLNQIMAGAAREARK